MRPRRPRPAPPRHAGRPSRLPATRRLAAASGRHPSTRGAERRLLIEGGVGWPTRRTSPGTTDRDRRHRRLERVPVVRVRVGAHEGGRDRVHATGERGEPAGHDVGRDDGEAFYTPELYAMLWPIHSAARRSLSGGVPTGCGSARENCYGNVTINSFNPTGDGRRRPRHDRDARPRRRGRDPVRRQHLER